MRIPLIAVVAVAAACNISTAVAEVGVSLNIGQPGFYGQIDIGDYPQPRVIYRQPMVVERVEMDRPPIYLRVPPGHAKHWDRHCREYNACGERVLFVQDQWYRHEYVPRYQQRNDERRGGDRGDRGDQRNGHGDEGRGDRHDNERGGGEHGHGHGHDR